MARKTFPYEILDVPLDLVPLLCYRMALFIGAARHPCCPGSSPG